MEQALETVKEVVTVYGLRIVAAIVIFVVGRIAAGAVRRMLRRLMRKREADPTLTGFVVNMAYYALLAFVVVATLAKLGIQTASFVAVLGAAGLAVGLALQGSLANFAAGVLLLVMRPFRVGDYVEPGSTAGTVEGINILTTELKSPDNREITVPNAQITSGSIVNYTAREMRRIDLVAGVGYGDDLDRVRRALEEVLAADERILSDPAPTIGVLELGDSSVNFAVRPWVKTGDYWAVYFDTQEAIKKRFDSEGISIPFPQTDVHLFGEEA